MGVGDQRQAPAALYPQGKTAPVIVIAVAADLTSAVLVAPQTTQDLYQAGWSTYVQDLYSASTRRHVDCCLSWFSSMSSDERCGEDLNEPRQLQDSYFPIYHS
jgi:hypothetical protein